MVYVVREVCDRRSLRDFLEVPFNVYRGDSHWIPPLSRELRRVLDPVRNPYFRNATLSLFVCYDNDRPIARSSVVINRMHEKKFGVRSAFFGFFEAIDDGHAVRELFAAIEEYCRNRRVELLEGPFNPNHYSELGMQTNKFGTPPTFFQVYNPHYYHRLLTSCGFSVAKQLFTCRNDSIREYIRRRYGTSNQSCSDRGFVVRSLRMDDLGSELERIREVFNDAFSSNWHFLHATEEEYRFSTKFLRLVTEPDLVKIAEYAGRPVGALMCVLDVNPLLKTKRGRVNVLRYLRFLRERRNIKNLIIYAVGIKKTYQRSPVFPLLLNAMCAMAERYDVLETTWMSAENVLAVKAAERLGLRPDKEFAIYEKCVKDGTL